MNELMIGFTNTSSHIYAFDRFLSSNELSGTIPSSIGSLVSLQYLYVNQPNPTQPNPTQPNPTQP